MKLTFPQGVNRTQAYLGIPNHTNVKDNKINKCFGRILTRSHTPLHAQPLMLGPARVRALSEPIRGYLCSN